MHFQQESEMKYQFILDNSESFPVGKMSAALNVHRSRYNRWLKTSEKRKRKLEEEQKLVVKIKDILEKYRYSYGTPRIPADKTCESLLNTFISMRP